MLSRKIHQSWLIPKWVVSVQRIKVPRIIVLYVQGILTSETRCLNCETVTSKDEDFFDLSIDVDQVGIVFINMYF